MWVRNRGKIPFLAYFNIKNLVLRYQQFRPQQIKRSDLEKNITFLESQIDAEGYVIENNIENGLPEITADADMLYQAFLNILINAMQAMPDGGKILINASLANDMVTVSVDDEGMGIPEEHLEKIWDPFFSTKEKGTGLGLGIVKNIIESHGGIVRISNRPGCGARVKIELPRGDL